ncbi:MFS transporter [Amycolatopsis endophytica]|uniref:Na+/melibiose symporter-like transporter n=1 Tax=Amycolatopsis endophytica TaxID=860233 RepID=A0A853B7J2_9PSEU|nr:MFS transporter [Amycolatopsis endophytica]NYI90762.1 Na+/melibiose symporter-like transporter [Amycolatopsis endophytica]
MSADPALTAPVAAPGADSPRTLYVSVVARAANRLATETLTFAIPLLIYSATQSLAWSGLTLALEWLPRLAGIPAAGPLVDRYGARRCLVIAEIARVMLLLGALAGVLLVPAAWLVLVLLALAIGAFGQASYIAVEKLGVQINGSKPIAWTQSVQAGIDQTAMVAGPFVAGVLVVWGPVWTLAAMLVLVLISMVLCRRLPEQESGPRSRRSAWEELTAGVRGVRRNPALVHIVLSTAAFNLLAGLILGMTPAYVEDRFGLTASSSSIVRTAGAAASLAVILVMTRLAARLDIVRVGLVSGLLACAGAVAAGLSPGFAPFLVWTCVFLGAEGAFACFLRIARARVIPVAEFGVTVSAVVLLVQVPYPIAGVLLAATPLGNVPLLMAACVLACVAVTLFSFSRLRRLPS